MTLWPRVKWRKEWKGHWCWTTRSLTLATSLKWIELSGDWRSSGGGGLGESPTTQLHSAVFRQLSAIDAWLFLFLKHAINPMTRQPATFGVMCTTPTQITYCPWVRMAYTRGRGPVPDSWLAWTLGRNVALQKVYVTPYAFARFKEMERSNIVLYSGEAVALVGVLHLLVVFCEIVVFSVSTWQLMVAGTISCGARMWENLVSWGVKSAWCGRPALTSMWVSEEQDLLVRRPAGVKGVGRSQIRRRGHRSVNCILMLRPHLCLCSYLFKLTHLYNLVERC